MKLNLNHILKTTLLTSAIVLATTLTPATVSAAANIDGGNFMTATNNTSGNGTWGDPVSAKPGEAIEFRVQVWNNGDATAERVQVIGDLSAPDSNTLQAKATIQSANLSTMQDTATINVEGGSAQSFAYIPGHARIFGVTNLYNCPSGCAFTDDIAGRGVEVGDIPAGQSVQVAFKAYVSNAVSATPTPTPTATPTPSTPPSGGQSQSQNQSQSQTVNVNNTNNNNNTVTVNTPAVAAPQVVSQSTSTAKALPKTGLPLAAVGMSALLPVGLKLRKRFTGSDTDSANFIWEERLFKKD